MKNFVILSIVSILVSCSNNSEKQEQALSQKVSGVEFADFKLIEVGKKAMNDFAQGNIESWVDAFSEDAVFSWSNGDNIKGKTNILNYWIDRRTNVIDTYEYSNDFWLPIKSSEPILASSNGYWLFLWCKVNIKYKDGRKIETWIHNDYHFNSDSKIDKFIHYVDREAINPKSDRKVD